MEFECTVQEVRPAITVAFRFTSSEAQMSPNLMIHFPRVAQFLLDQGERPAGFPYVCIYNMDELVWQVECGFPVAHPVPGNEEFVASSIPGGRCATTMHRGSLTKMRVSYDRLKNWMEAQGMQARGPFYEVPMSDPRKVKEEDLYAGLMIPI